MSKKKISLAFLTLTVLVIPNFVVAATFQSGDRALVSLPLSDDLYVAGGQVSVESEINGDLIGAGGEINVSGNVSDDIIMAGGRVILRGDVGDDIRVAGGEIEISGKVENDVIVAGGGSIRIFKDAEIGGDLVINGGEVRLEGVVKGNLIVNAGRILLDGSVNGKTQINGGVLELNGNISGPSRLVADEIVLGPAVNFGGAVEYWTGKGEVDFKSFNATYNTGIAKKVKNWEKKGRGAGVFFGVICFLSGLLIVSLLLSVRKFFSRASVNLKEQNWKSFGYGVLYFVLMPVASLVLMITLIGLPIGMFMLFVYIFSFVFAMPLVALTVASCWEKRFKKTWNNWRFLGVAVGILILLKIISLIPIVGALLIAFGVASVFGAIMIEKAEILKSIRK